MKPDANNQLTCNVCGEAWPQHGVGGNCKQSAKPVSR
jgi:hypothetical protein